MANSAISCLRIYPLDDRTYGYLTYYNNNACLPPQNLTRTQFLKGILVLIFPGREELQKAVLLLECPQEVKLRFSFYAFHVIW